MKLVKVFLASSVELDEDKTCFDHYFSEKNKIYRKRHIDFDQRTWKDFSSSLNSDGRLQDRYNAYLAECDIAIFLFHTRMGKYTVEELEKAREQYHRSGRKPRIFIFFKETPDQASEMTDFKRQCEMQWGHFCDTYSTYEELLSKFDKQLQILENEKFIRPDPIDLPRIIRFTLLFVLLPLVIIALGFSAFYYFTPNIVTVRVEETSPSPLLFEGAEISIQYADKHETQSLSSVKEELIFKEIHSRHMGKPVKITLSAPGYLQVDTMQELSKNIVLPIQRDNTYGRVFGMVKDEDNTPIEGVCVGIGELQSLTNASGYFSIEIPARLQATEQRVVATKQGYKLWDFTGPVSDKVEWKIILKK